MAVVLFHLGLLFLQCISHVSYAKVDSFLFLGKYAHGDLQFAQKGVHLFFARV